MASLSRNGKGRPGPEMNVTPLVDVVLVLLIIFMVVLPNTEKGAPVDVPQAQSGLDDPDGEEPFVLSVTEVGEMYFETEKLDDSSFRKTLTAANERAPKRKLILRGDYRVKYQRVRDLFRICQDIGFPGVSLRVNANTDGVDTKRATASVESHSKSEG